MPVPTVKMEHNSSNVATRSPVKQQQTFDRQETFLAAYRINGTIRTAAKEAEVHRVTVGRWLDSDTQGFRTRFNDAKYDFREDLEESALLWRLREPNCPPLLVIFALKAHWPDKYRDDVKPADSAASDLIRKLEEMGSKRIVDVAVDDDLTPVEQVDGILGVHKSEQGQQ